MKFYDAWVQDPEANPIPPSLREIAWRAGLRRDPASAVEALKKEWFNTKSIDGKMICLATLALTDDAELIKNSLIPFLFNKSPPQDSVPSVDMHFLGGGMAWNPIARPLLWDFIKNNYDAAIDKLDNPIVVDRFIRVTLGSFTDVSYVDEIDAFFKDKDTSSYNRSLETAKDKVRGLAAYKSRDAVALKEWLSSHGY